MIPFHKYESIGNDFILIEPADLDYSDFAHQTCRRRFGIGADGLLVVERRGDLNSMRMFNPDGSEDFCGNGLRCAALHLHNLGVEPPMRIAHGGAECDIQFSKAGWIDVSLPAASFDPAHVPLREGENELFERELIVGGERLIASALTAGSTHTVLEREQRPNDELFQSVSPVLETDPRFPARTSVIWAWQESAQKIAIRIWERGVGETMGCGTGSAAAAAVWFRRNPGLLAIGVVNPGGEAVVGLGPNGGLIVGARAQRVYSGSWLGNLSTRLASEFA